MKLLDDVYVYEWTNLFDNNCNSYYIGGSVQAIVDPGLKRHFPALLKSMEEDGIDKSDVKYIINTYSLSPGPLRSICVVQWFRC